METGGGPEGSQQGEVIARRGARRDAARNSRRSLLLKRPAEESAEAANDKEEDEKKHVGRPADTVHERGQKRRPGETAEVLADEVEYGQQANHAPA